MHLVLRHEQALEGGISIGVRDRCVVQSFPTSHGLLRLLSLKDDIGLEHFFNLGRQVAAIAAGLLHQHFVQREVDGFLGDDVSIKSSLK
jgi:hypothetical protein